MSKAFRTIVDTLAFWRAQYDQLTADKRYDPPHLVALEVISFVSKKEAPSSY